MSPRFIDPDKATDFRKRSQWLIAELLVIVLGVLIALAIDQWREGVENAKIRKEYLHQLIADLQSTEDLMAEVGEENEVSLAAVDALVDAFESNAEPSLEKTRELLRTIQTFNNPVPVLGTAEALISTGDLRLIENAQSQTEITRYLSRSRDFFLVPLYPIEDDCAKLLHQINTLAIKDGIGIRQEDLRHGGNTTETEVAAFMDNAEAYAIALTLKRLMHSMKYYRDGIAADALKLRTSLQSQISAE